MLITVILLAASFAMFAASAWKVAHWPTPPWKAMSLLSVALTVNAGLLGMSVESMLP